MDQILTVLLNERDSLETKRVEQVVNFCGNGLLSDDSDCSKIFRDFLKNIPSDILKKYATECLDGSVGRNPNSGLILQDVVNEVGDRLGYEVTPGYYRGAPSRIGNDGLWRSRDFSFVLEVKTSDLSIKLDPIAKYRTQLVDANQLTEDTSSILIVLGRQDTGDLEAQIRGSRHAWDIRMIGIDSLFRLLDIKENLNDPRSVYKITELLKPIEYTRVDKLIDVVFLTSQDISTADNPEIPSEELSSKIINLEKPNHAEQQLIVGRSHSSPVNFYEKCMARVNQKLGKQFIKNGRVTYTSSDKISNVVLLNSKAYDESEEGRSFWYGFRPNQNEFLSEKESSYVAFGCGNEETIILIPFSRFKGFISELVTTNDTEGSLVHSHVFIFEANSRFSMRVGDRYVDITEYVI